MQLKLLKPCLCWDLVSGSETSVKACSMSSKCLTSVLQLVDPVATSCMTVSTFSWLAFRTIFSILYNNNCYSYAIVLLINSIIIITFFKLHWKWKEKQINRKLTNITIVCIRVWCWWHLILQFVPFQTGVAGFTVIWWSSQITYPRKNGPLECLFWDTPRIHPG